MTRKWTSDLTKSLVEFYELQPVLYKVDSPNYHNKVMRQKAILSIQTDLEKMYKETFLDGEILKKINNLRSQFLDCLRSTKMQPASGSCAGSKTKWWLFDHMQFLRPYCTKEKGQSKINMNKRKHLESDEALVPVVLKETTTNLSENFLGDDSQEVQDHIEEGYYDVSTAGECCLSPVPTPTPLASEQETIPIPKKKILKKKKYESVKDGVEKEIRTAIDKIVNETPVQESLPEKEIKTLCSFLETQLLQIKNKHLLSRLKWDMLNLVCSAQNEDDD